jgi:polyphosphate glucokinase
LPILVVDVGGTSVKLYLSETGVRTQFSSGPTLTPEDLVFGVKTHTSGWAYDRVTLGIPSPVVRDRVMEEPWNLGPGWVGFEFAAAFGVPVKLVNDAAMQALGSYEGGRMLFLGLGTGLGSALIVERVVAPLELAHLPYKKGRTFEDYVGIRGLKRLGKKKWQKAVEDVIARLQAALIADYVVLGGGNSKRLERLPPGARLGDNQNAFIGGYRMWEDKLAGEPAAAKRE